MADTGRLVGLVVTLVAAIVVIAAVAIPVMSSVTDDIHVTAENEDYDMRMSVLGTDSYYKIEYIKAGAIAITTEKGGDATTYWGTDYSDEGTTLVDGLLGGFTGVRAYVWFTTDEFSLRYTTSTGAIQLFGIEGTGTGGMTISYAGAYLEWDAGTLTVYRSLTGDYYFESYTYVVVPDPDGSWVMTTAGWVNYGSTYYLTTSNAWGPLVQSGGDAVKVTDATSVTVTQTVTDDGTRAAYVGVPTVSYVLDGTEATIGSYWERIVVPLEYYTTSSSQDTILSIVNVIPLLLVLMILITAAYAVIRSVQE